MPRRQKAKKIKPLIKKASKKTSLFQTKKKSSNAPLSKAKKLSKKIAVKIKRKIKILRKKSPFPVKFSAGAPEVNEIPQPLKSDEFDSRIPSGYGDNVLVLLVRDPWWIYAYWEISKSREEEVSRSLQAKHARHKKTVLRIYDVTGKGLPEYNSFFDIELNIFTNNWYVDVGLPGRDWVAEIGYRTPDGNFYGLVRSNLVRTPAFGLSEILDEQWMLPEEIYLKIIGQGFAGSASSISSMDIRKLLEKYLRNIVSSERVASPWVINATPVSG